MNELLCQKCGKALTKPRTGRPPTFCSTACRRAGEYEAARINRHLEKLETKRIKLDIVDNCYLKDFAGRTRAEQLADVDRIITGLEKRLLGLLENSDLRFTSTHPSHPKP